MRFSARLFPLCLVLAAAPVAAAELKLLQPLGRTAYQTNEWIDLTLRGQDGSLLRFRFDVPARTAVAGQARGTELLHLNGRLLRPGGYAVEIACDGAVATGQLDLYTHLRKTSYRLISWGRAQGEHQLAEGEDNLGFNLFYGHYGQDKDANFLRAGVDYMANCVMSGGHQMDLRMECDWSDPYVTRGGTRRVVRQAFIDRTRPHVPGVHFYDEPGLTWHKHPTTGEFTPHGVPAQVRAYQSASAKRRSAITSFSFRTRNTSPAGSIGPAGNWGSWTPPGKRRSSEPPTAGSLACRRRRTRHEITSRSQIQQRRVAWAACLERAEGRVRSRPP